MKSRIARVFGATCRVSMTTAVFPFSIDITPWASCSSLDPWSSYRFMNSVSTKYWIFWCTIYNSPVAHWLVMFIPQKYLWFVAQSIINHIIQIYEYYNMYIITIVNKPSIAPTIVNFESWNTWALELANWQTCRGATIVNSNLNIEKLNLWTAMSQH